MSKFLHKPTIDKSTPVYTLSVVATLTGIPKPSILQYISKGLIVPFKKETKRNLFSDIDVSRLKHIRFQLEEQGLNVAGIKAQMALIPCWAIRSCSDDDRARCEAYTSFTQPCWEASEKGTKCKNSDCRQCNVYQSLDDSHSIKDVIKQLIN